MFRDITQSDKGIFLAMAQEFYFSPAVMHPINPTHFSTTFDAAINKNPFFRVLIIELENRIIGYAILSFTYSNEAGGMVVLIEEVHIEKAYRSNGIGTKLLDFVEKEYPAFKRFRLEVTKDNLRAIDLYQKRGYQELDYVQMIKDVE
jgi:ribosomal protein S18 acetylase RimI-like enzyme